MQKIITQKMVRDYYPSAKELAKYLGVSERQVHYYRTNGKLNAINRGRARYQFNSDAVIDFLIKEWGFVKGEE